MIRVEYKQSTEYYKGFTLEVWRYMYIEDKGWYHRECRLFKEGQYITTYKTKKEVKEMIDANMY